MKTFIIYDEKSRTKYSLRIVADDGKVQVTPIDRTYPGEPTTLVLPDNPSNRKYFSTKKLEEIGEDGLELTYKESKTFGPRLPGSTSPRKPLEDYLEPDERKLYDELMAKARARREEANKPKPLTELEKAQRAYERELKKLEEAKAKFQALKAKGDFTAEL